MKKTTESGWTIPDDWDTVSWQCYALQWPDSPKFELLLRSLLYSLTRGREWDKFTGNIKTAQLYGWDIFNRNDPLLLCADLPCPDGNGDGDHEEPCRGGILVELEENEMGQVVTDVTVNADGTLRIWFGPCCYHDLTGITIADRIPDSGDSPLVPSGGPTPDYSACGKASAIVDAIVLVLQGTYDALLEFDWPWQILPNVEQSVGYNLDNKWLALLVVDWMAYGTVLTPADVFSYNDQQTSKCSLEGLFEDDALGIPDDETYQAVKAALHTRNFLYDGLIMTAVACLGRGNLDNIAKLGAGDTVSQCVCPGAGLPDPDPTPPDENGWYLGAEILTLESFEDDSYIRACTVHTAEHDVFGYVMKLAWNYTDQTLKRMAYANSPCTDEHDTDWWDNTSDHLEEMNQTALFCSVASEALCAIACSLWNLPNNYVWLEGAGADYSDTPASPDADAVQGKKIGIQLEHDVSTGGYLIWTLRPLMNINSPSHA